MNVGTSRAGAGARAVLTIVVFAVLILSSAAAWGQDKTDVVTLANGDRITGDISDLERGRIAIKTNDAGTIEIEWDKVARVEGKRLFEVVTGDGRRLLGGLGATGDVGPATNRVVLVVASDGTGVLLPMLEVTSITPIGASFWRRLDGSISAGFSYTRSSAIAQATLNGDVKFRRPAFEFGLTTSATLTDQSDETKDDSRASADLSYLRYPGRRWFWGGAGRLESNKSLGLTLRSTAGGAVGMRFVNTNRAQLAVGSGLVVNEEQGVDTEPTENLEGLFTYSFSYYAYDQPKTNLDASVQYYPSLSDWGRQRLQIDASAKRELWSDFTVGVNIYDTFDSAPPNPDAARNDVGVTASVGWTFGR